ncbi:hypothetical protein N1851_003715 [Merluccius polli]|uniref:DUF5641 domain-containing protein n=1 Tax=Merluccius polli TaxID=89951 RepID=A0AA47PBD6_MERPO|nr:hypothetical protein N1851_003715 [Merluccius polli]
MADIRSMFHQVRVSAKDVDFLRFLWWPEGDVDQRAVEHRMLVHFVISKLRKLCTPMERALGLQWCIENDAFMFKITLKQKPLTQRGLLSVVSSVYDPLGFLAPLILPVKHMLQQLCKEKYGWDEPIPSATSQKWIEWTSSLEKLNDFSVARCFKSKHFGKPTRAQLHHFSDASENGYGTASYLRMENDQGEQGVFSIHFQNHVLSELRKRYWITNANSAVRSIINKCVICRRVAGRTKIQKMADLPQERLMPDLPPFTNTGMDYFGPIATKRARSLRWAQEYLPLLQERQKWINPKKNIQTGDIVLIVDATAPRGSWMLGRALQTFQDGKGLVRSVRIRTKTSCYGTRKLGPKCWTQGGRDRIKGKGIYWVIVRGVRLAGVWYGAGNQGSATGLVVGQAGVGNGLVVGQAGVGNGAGSRTGRGRQQGLEQAGRQAGRGRQQGLDRWVVRQAGVGNKGWTGGSSGRQGSATRAGQVGRQAGRGRQQGLDRWVVRQAGVGNKGWTGGSSGRQGSATRAGTGVVRLGITSRLGKQRTGAGCLTIPGLNRETVIIKLGTGVCGE